MLFHFSLHLNVCFIFNLFLYGVYGMREGEQVSLFVFLYRQLVALILLTGGKPPLFFSPLNLVDAIVENK